MTGVWALAALWLGLALVASLLSIWFRISTALSEIVVGTIAQLIIGAVVGSAVLGTNESWVQFLSGIGAIVLTFLAGAELDPVVFKLKWKEAAAVGLASFFFPFLGCAAAAHYLLGWDVMPSWLAGVAMSTTSVAVVYAVMLEFGFNVTEYGKTVLAACFVTDLGTVVALGLIFAPFTMKTLIFLGVGVVVFVVLLWLTPRFFKVYGKSAVRAGDEVLAVLPARHGGAGRVGRQRSGASGLSHRNGACRNRRQGSCARATSADLDLRIADAVLLYPRRFVRLDTCARRRADCVRFLSYGENCLEDCRCLPGDEGLRRAEPGGDVHDPPDVDGAYVRNDLVPVRAFPWNHRPRPIFGAGRRGDRERRDSDDHRQRLLSATPPAAPDGSGKDARRAVRSNAAFADFEESRIAGGRPMFSKILHANDGSEQAFHALSLALAIARQNDSELHMVSIEEIPYLPEFNEEVRQETGTAARRYRAVFERARAMAKESQVELYTHLLAGHPVRDIVQLAAELKVELLVIGATGHSAL
jgi:nucleotide-binding universal stress UspA family protein